MYITLKVKKNIIGKNGMKSKIITMMKDQDVWIMLIVHVAYSESVMLLYIPIYFIKPLQFSLKDYKCKQLQEFYKLTHNLNKLPIITINSFYYSCYINF